MSRSNLFLVPLDDEGGWYRFHHLFAQLLRVELEQREPGLAPELHRRAYAWHRDHGTTGEAIKHAMAAGANAEAAELIEGHWISYANMCRYDTVLAWLRRLPAEILSGDVQLLLVQAWVLSLSARRKEAAQAIAAVERLGDLGAGPLPDGLSSGEASLTLLRACFPWGDAGAQMENGRRAAELEGPGSPWRPLACWAAGTGLYFRGEPEEADGWFAESAALAPASEQWLAGESSLVYRSWIAGEQGHLDKQRALADAAAGFVREHGTGKVIGGAPLALGVLLAARGQARGGTATDRTRRRLLADLRPALQLANALSARRRCCAPWATHVCRGCDSRGQDYHLESCPDPGILAGRLAAPDRPPQIRRVRCADQELSRREFRVLKLLQGDLSERDIGRELYVSHSTVHSHVRAIYRSSLCSRADALKRGHELGLL